MLELEEFYNLLKAHFDFYYSYETPQDLTITLSYDQVKKLKCALSGFVELNSPNENWQKY